VVAGLALTGIGLTSERRGCTALVFRNSQEEMGQYESIRPRARLGGRRLNRIVSLLIVVAVAAACDRSTEASTGSSSTSLVEASGQNDEAIWSSASKIKMIDDPVGDSIPETSPFMDTVAYGVDWVGNDEQGGGTFLFRFEVAAPIPNSFQVPMGHDAAQYSFCLDSDPSTSPGGYPFANNDPVWCEFILTAVSDGGAWSGTLIDRRPLLEGSNAETPGISFLTQDTDGLFAVSDDLLGDPKSFSWAMTASLLMLPLPSDEFIDLDANYEQMIAFDR
jgi:hypothetical protein